LFLERYLVVVEAISIDQGNVILAILGDGFFRTRFDLIGRSSG
jgi:hypothetical protein